MRGSRYEVQIGQKEQGSSYYPADRDQTERQQGSSSADINYPPRSIYGETLAANLETQSQTSLLGYLIDEQKKRKWVDGQLEVLDRPNREDLGSGQEEPMCVEEQIILVDPKNGLEAGPGSQARLDQ